MNDIQQNPLLDSVPAEHRAGFRLQRFEVYNWGTFHEHVWTIVPGGDNSLLTGDIGSGKSTLVDAMTTLLVPPQRITYNKAAGAEARERTLRTYVLGYYKSERIEAGVSARAVALRGHNDYSVVLGQFYNEGYDRHVTLAQVFWMRDSQGPPARFYVVAESPLTIAGDFSGFGTDINHLRKRLRRQSHIELHDSFPPYSLAFRRLLGLDNEQALELFNQTVSMKSVGNLTDFVRSHMLESFPVDDRVDALVRHFDDLDRAHQAVLKARDQINALTPLATDARRHAELAQQAEELRGCREALRPWFAQLRSDLLEPRLERLRQDMERVSGGVIRLEEQRRTSHGRRDEVRQAIAASGGDRLDRLGTEISRLQEQHGERRGRAEACNRLACELGLIVAQDEDGFRANRRDAEESLAAVDERRAAAQNRLTEVTVELRGLQDRHNALARELESLRQRRSNIDDAMVRLRVSLCEATGLAAEKLPFAGELLQVRDEERDWEGAIERVLHGFGLSLLVPDTHYATVSAWVDQTHLRGRLVYYRVRASRTPPVPDRHAQSLLRKLVIQPESAHYSWLEQELARRFDYACCVSLEQFRREQRAITRAGQVKGGGERHEKDDRHPIDDRSRYVLGWSNEAKITALEKQRRDVDRQMLGVRKSEAEIRLEQKRLRERENTLHRLLEYRDFRDLDWQPLTVEIQKLEQERRALEASSDLLRTLQEQLSAVEKELTDIDSKHTAAVGERAALQSRQSDAEQMLSDARTLLAAVPQEAKARYFPQLDEIRGEAFGTRKLTVESCDNIQSETREWLQARIDAEDKKIGRLRECIIDAMRKFKTTWPLETSEMDVSIESADEYCAMLARLRTDDLPRFEARFKSLLNENTIREVAGFQAQLNREREQIKERIAIINRSLQAIDYNPNRYITLQAELAHDAEINDFRESLRACTEGALTGSEDDQYSEAKFLQVKAIIERFRGREGQTEIDRRWKAKVTDVRNWHAFSASERWREDDKEYEHYTDSGGKSGGQKEKLAYTVLAASLAYQFGLEWGEQRSRSFRFVVIDEAFGRGSDESTRYGLELFKRLNLQLLIVTPLQKIHIIEPYVASVGFVHNEDGRHSRARQLTIAEYRAERTARALIRAS
jgi:uncharacterized protein YPO0396